MITRSATDPNRFTRRLAFTTSARAAWRLLLERVCFAPGETALLPAYIGVTDREGSGVLDPIEQTRTPYTLYGLGGRLEVDCDLIESHLRRGNHPLVLVVHYFGLVHVDLQRLRRLCDEYRALLVEDCAHVPDFMARKAGPGSVGQAAFYSLHKIIAAPTGGVLRVNDDALALPTPLGDARCKPEVLEQLLRTDLAAAAALRREHYEWLAKQLGGVRGLTVLYPELGDAVPHDFPILVHDGLRERLYFALMDEGLPTTALYYRLIDTIDPEQFPVSHGLSRGILNLPVHQDTQRADLEHLVERIHVHLLRLRS